MSSKTALLLATLLAFHMAFSQQPAPKPGIPQELWSPVATFSILGYDPSTGEVGGAVQSRVFSVGNGVLWGPGLSGGTQGAPRSPRGGVRSTCALAI